VTGGGARGRKRSWIFFLLRILVSVALLGWLLHRLQGGLGRLGDLNLAGLWPAAVLFALATVLGATQWLLILRHVKIPITRKRAHFLYWVGLFFNNFLPTNVGGDLVKVGDIALNQGNVLRPLAATLLDRLMGLFALVLWTLGASLVLGGGRAPAGVPWWLLTLAAVTVMGILGALLSRRLGALLMALVRRYAPPGRGGRLHALLQEFAAFRVAPWFLARVLVLALFVQSLRILTHVAVGRVMGIPFDLARVVDFFVLIPLLGMAIVLPVSFNGLGVREWVATRLMPGIGIGAEDAFIMELATYLVQVTVSGVGGVLFLMKMVSGRWRSRSDRGSGGLHM
jgi:hypothetical protein